MKTSLFILCVLVCSSALALEYQEITETPDGLVVKINQVEKDLITQIEAMTDAPTCDKAHAILTLAMEGRVQSAEFLRDFGAQAEPTLKDTVKNSYDSFLLLFGNTMKYAKKFCGD